MRNLFRSWLSWRRSQSAKPLPRRRPEVETLEDRAVPSITLPTGGPGAVTLTGTSQPDQLMIRLQAPTAGSTVTNIEFSDNGGATFQSTALANVTQVIVNGGGGKDALTLDLGNGVIGNTTTAGLPIQFNGGPGNTTVNLVGNPGGTLTETFTLGTGSSLDTLTLSNGTLSMTLSVSNRTSIVDSVPAANFIFNGNANNNLIHLQSQSRQGVTSLIIKGVDAQDVNGSSTGSDDNENETEDETTSNAFAPLTLSNKTNVTVNGLGGDDQFVTNIHSVPTGLTTLTLDGGTGTNVLVGEALPTGMTTNLLNITRQDTDADDVLIDNLFAERLHRPPDTVGKNFWKGILNSAGRSAVIQGIEDSLEARTNLLETWYQRFLGRNVDQAGVQFWTNVMAQGATEEQVESGILASQEFLQRAQSLVGSSNQNENFIRAAFRLLLNRDGDAAALTFFGNLLQSNGRDVAALNMLQSQEFRTLTVNAFYQTLLGRNLDDAGRNFWVNGGQDLAEVRKGIETSDEFFNRR